MDDEKNIEQGRYNPDDLTRAFTDFVEIEQSLQDVCAYSLGDNMDESDIYELVRQNMSIHNIKDVTAIIVAAILARKETQDLRIKNIQLQGELTKLTHRASSIKNEIDMFNAHEGTMEIDTEGEILSVNDFMIKHSGYSRVELVGQNMRVMSSGTHSKKFWENFWVTIKSGRVWAGDICNKRKDGTFIWLWTLVMPKLDSTGKLESFKVIRQDISESYVLKRKLEEMTNQRMDTLTGLPNHAKYLEDFGDDTPKSLAILHVNNMFDINSVFGRARGDDIIKLIGGVLRNFAETNNVHAYKFEGTDFGIVFGEGASEAEMIQSYEKLTELEAFDNEKRIPLSFSLGIVLREPDTETLLRHGFIALKEAKQTRKHVVFNDKNHTDKESKDFFEMRNLVKEAFREDLFEVHFQEIRENSCSIKKNGVRKFECLIRMYDSVEKTNLIPPIRFLPIIKKEGENPAITECVIRKVCEFMVCNEGHFSINLTEEDLRITDFAEIVSEKVKEYDIEPWRITFEILEEIENIESRNILDNIQGLKRFGFQIAIDDFGAGHSNFSRMLNFEPNYIKVDMSYVRGIDTNPKHRSLVKAIVGLAHDNGMAVVGEGVETKEEQLVLESLGVDYSQGYLFSRPSSTI